PTEGRPDAHLQRSLPVADRHVPSLASLESADIFADRHVGPQRQDRQDMLAVVGYDSLDHLVDAAMPPQIRASKALDLPPALSETAALRRLRDYAAHNRPLAPMIGLGYHGTITPPVIRRNVLEDPSWYTAYTPYQPEISQGRLEALLNFQTMVSDLTGLTTSNASLLDEGTAAAEAMTLVRRANKKADGPFVVDADALPQTIEVIRTRAAAMGIEVVVADLAEGLPEGELSGVLVQYPGASGRVLDPRAVIEETHQRGALAVVAADLQHLHRAGAAGGGGLDVRRLPRPRRPHRDRAVGARAGGRARRAAPGRGSRGRARGVLRHRDGTRARPWRRGGRRRPHRRGA